MADAGASGDGRLRDSLTGRSWMKATASGPPLDRLDSPTPLRQNARSSFLTATATCRERMLFTEPRFLFLFLPVVLFFYYVSPRAAKNVILLVASILFYSWDEGYSTAVILFSIVFNFFLGHVIDGQDKPGARKGTVALAIAINLLLLIHYKYAGFIVENLNVLLAAVKLPLMNVPKNHLPIGISFFTFHAVSYIVDVYRREVTPMKRFDSFALYITLFPQLIAGPIIRYKTICDQFSLDAMSGRKHDVEAFAYGIRRFIIGLGKKMLIANTMAIAADGIFAAPMATMTPGAAWLGIVCYSLQIYFDFSGYSDMAIGLGHMFGFTFPENFNFPYISRSVTEFWRRWHMSLSTWFRDYLYIPLGGNRVSAGRTYFNLLVVFFLCGLWHGATWNFIVWGLYFGVFLVLERLGLGKILEWLPRPFQHAYLLLVVMVGWVFFRADSMGYAMTYLARMAFVSPSPDSPHIPAHIFMNTAMITALIAGIIGSMPWLPNVQTAWKRWSNTTEGAKRFITTAAVRTFELATLAIIFLGSCGFSAINTYNPFIYFRF
jgi:alginate O-acetyltransferase complex protein AlgI